jgi:chemotaxis protein CheD
VRTVGVDISDYRVTAEPDDVLVTWALGSCIAVMVHDPGRRAGGMIHYMLPLAETAPERARERPAMFADTGVPLLFRSMYALGCRKEDLVVKLAGGSAMHDDGGVFQIGKRNLAIVRKLLWKAGICVAAEDVGGAKTRTVRLHVGTGRCTVASPGQEVEL